MPTKIEWADETINPIQDKIKGKSGRGYHCTKISLGCTHCYAEGMNKRFGNGLPFDNRKAEFELVQSELEKPLRWKKPRRIFVQSMGDLLHYDVPNEFVLMVQGMMQRCMLPPYNHTFIVLTKREARLSWFSHNIQAFPQNCWIGVTCENQDQADKRIPILLQIPAAVRFVSVEPMLGPVDLVKAYPEYYYVCSACGRHGDYTGERECIECGGKEENSSNGDCLKCRKGTMADICPQCGTNQYKNFNSYGPVWTYLPEHAQLPGINWVICGGESGPGARPMHPDWVRSLGDQAIQAGVPFFFKHFGEWADYFSQPGSDGPRWAPEAKRLDSLPYKYVTPDGHIDGVARYGSAKMVRVGKKAAGRLLDGREWSEFPK